MAHRTRAPYPRQTRPSHLQNVVHFEDGAGPESIRIHGCAFHDMRTRDVTRSKLRRSLGAGRKKAHETARPPSTKPVEARFQMGGRELALCTRHTIHISKTWFTLRWICGHKMVEAGRKAREGCICGCHAPATALISNMLSLPPLKAAAADEHHAGGRTVPRGMLTINSHETSS